MLTCTPITFNSIFMNDRGLGLTYDSDHKDGAPGATDAVAAVTGQQGDRVLVAGVEFGLGDRIMVALNALDVARRSGRAFTFLWRRTDACNCDANAIFVTNLRIVEGTDIYADTPWIQNLPSNDAVPFTDVPIVKLWGFRRIYPKDFTRYFYPAEEIDDAIRRFVMEFGNDYIGVHVRRTDKKHVPVEYYFEKLEEHLPATGRLLLATDDATGEVPLAFRKRYGRQVVEYPVRSLERNTPNAIKDASTILWLLRRAQFIIGSARSNFSKVAAAGRRNVLVSESTAYEYNETTAVPP